MEHRVERMRSRLRAAQPALDGGEAVLATDVALAGGRPLQVRVRRRDRRYDLTDDGAAVGAAGRPTGWLPEAERVVGARGMNVNRRGVVFVPAVEGRDIAALAVRLADAAGEVHSELLELAEQADA